MYFFVSSRLDGPIIGGGRWGRLITGISRYTAISDYNKTIPSTLLTPLSTNPLTDGWYKDCSAAAGMEKRQIPDKQVTASSFIKGHLPSQGRLNNQFKQVNGSALWGSWCADTEDISQYIQVLPFKYEFFFIFVNTDLSQDHSDANR